MGRLARAVKFCQEELKEEDLAFLTGLLKINQENTKI